jgi:hypothetical protein
VWIELTYSEAECTRYSFSTWTQVTVLHGEGNQMSEEEREQKSG